ncbi:MAG: hypothetical protein QF886_20245, partial [Planctomycetota bacterium]|nr:hypothetical protein [Planctomycetota bacterium]
DFQKSDALQHAASCARSLRDTKRADELLGQIPIDAVAKTERMESLLAQRKFTALIEQFGSEDLSKWPFWQIGAGAFARSRAYVSAKEGEKAEADLQTALSYTSATRPRISILTTMGNNRETNLQDDGAALEAFRQNYESKKGIGAADEYRSLQGAARILARQGKIDEALATLNRADIEKQKGYWRHAMLLSLGEVLEAAGRKAEALKAYRNVQADESALKSHREKAGEAIKSMK